MWTRFENNERLGHTARSLDVARRDPGIARPVPRYNARSLISPIPIVGKTNALRQYRMPESNPRGGPTDATADEPLVMRPSRARPRHPSHLFVPQLQSGNKNAFALAVDGHPCVRRPHLRQTLGLVALNDQLVAKIRPASKNSVGGQLNNAFRTTSWPDNAKRSN